MAGAHTAAQDVDIDLGRLFASLARHWLRILLVSLGVTGLALAFALLSTPLYRAETRLLIESRESVFTRTEANADNNNPVLDEEGVTSQVEVIGSTDILKRVAEKLDLSRYPEFDDAADMSLVGRLLVATGLRANPGEMPAEERVLRALQGQAHRLPRRAVAGDRGRVLVREPEARGRGSECHRRDLPCRAAGCEVAVQRRCHAMAGAGDRRPRTAGEGGGGEGCGLPLAFRPARRPEQFGARHPAALRAVDRAVAGARQPVGRRGQCGRGAGGVEERRLARCHARGHVVGPHPAPQGDAGSAEGADRRPVDVAAQRPSAHPRAQLAARRPRRPDPQRGGEGAGRARNRGEDGAQCARTSWSPISTI